MEEEVKNKIPFPQANDVNKIIAVIRIEQDRLFDNNYLIDLLSVTQRQVNYYLSACAFLGILDRKRHFTELGLSMKSKGQEGLIEALSQVIVSKPVFGEVFFNKLFNGGYLTNEEISELITFNYGVENIEVADRRASTVKKWVEWIFSHIEKRGLFYETD